ncbi:MAG: hypothetical protein ACI4L9_04455 [Candidatus Coproplasma sp.]
MESKKNFSIPKIEVIKFDATDVITDSITTTASYGLNDVTNIWNFFKVS